MAASVLQEQPKEITLGGETFRPHTIGTTGKLGYCSGALAFTTVWGGLQAGALSPFLTLLLYRVAGPCTAMAFAVLSAVSVLLPVSHSPAFCRFYLKAASLTGGSTCWFSDRVVKTGAGSHFMVCMHPHGILPLGFSFNGAIRVKTQQPANYLPSGVNIRDDCNGVQAPVLWRIPFMSAVLKLWGACTPATKQDMKRLMASGVPFGILPGGSDEVAVHEFGGENVYINSRRGFIKYGLEYGYAAIVCYTFGENDQYHSARCLRSVNLWLVQRFGFVLPFFWGKLCFPLLPKGGGLNTVYGDVLQLPKIPNPSEEEVVRWHARYVEALQAVFDAHKARFGYADRKLRCF